MDQIERNPTHVRIVGASLLGKGNVYKIESLVGNIMHIGLCDHWYYPDDELFYGYRDESLIVTEILNKYGAT